ncbi:hypothetical protein LTR17_020053 [Elasticomyces elasticus]|nr:hypothetical protein LTR17_020053 [Elasticomyces elasticus]
MPLDDLPNEILTHLFTHLPTLTSVLALSATSQHLHQIYFSNTTARLTILSAVLSTEFGPLDDIIQICTLNSSQPAHIRHTNVPLSDALVEQILKIGRCARMWEEIYPLKKWKTNYAARRLLTTSERFVFRRALYRLWLFSHAFHNSLHRRTSRNIPHVVAERSALLQNWSTEELAEMLDVHHMLRDVVANNICPSNGKIRQKYNKRYPESTHQPMFNIHLNYPPPAASWSMVGSDSRWMDPSIISSAKYTHNTRFQSRSNSRFGSHHDIGQEGWGDDINHYYVVEDMLKLDPQQLLFLRDRCPLKALVEMYVKANVDGNEGWYGNNGETFCETVWVVAKQRGMEVEELKREVEEGRMGVAVVKGGV